MDELYLYGRVLNDAEVLALSQGNAPAGAFAVYRMDAPARPGLDSFGNNRHLEPESYGKVSSRLFRTTVPMTSRIAAIPARSGPNSRYSTYLGCSKLVFSS